MPRQLDPYLAAALDGGYVELLDLVMLQFLSETRYVWSGVGDLVYAGNTYTGVGSLGTLGDVSEGTESRAEGTSVGLSGLDATMLAEALTDVQLGATARRWIAAMTPGTKTIIGTPYLLFDGQVDQPKTTAGAATSTISLALETRMVNHARASNRRYTASDQHANGYADDIGFNWVEILNDLALQWG